MAGRSFCLRGRVTRIFRCAGGRQKFGFYRGFGYPTHARYCCAWMGHPFLLGCWRKTKAKAKTEAGPSLRLKSAYGQDDGLLWGMRASWLCLRKAKTRLLSGLWLSHPCAILLRMDGAPGVVGVLAKDKSKSKDRSGSFPPAEKRLRSRMTGFVGAPASWLCLRKAKTQLLSRLWLSHPCAVLLRMDGAPFFVGVLAKDKSKSKDRSGSFPPAEKRLRSG